MNFNVLDFHTQFVEGSSVLRRRFRLRINYICDSFSLRIPKGTKTRLVGKLNVHVGSERCGPVFWALDGIGNVELVSASIRSIFKATAAEQVKSVKSHLRRGIRIAAKHDPLFGRHLKLWEHLLSTVDEEFDHDFRISRSHRSRRWRCNAVMRITPTAYHYDVLVKDGKSLEIIQRHRIKTTECLYPFFGGIGFSRLLWDGGDIVGLASENTEVFRFTTGLGA